MAPAENVVRWMPPPGNRGKWPSLYVDNRVVVRCFSQEKERNPEDGRSQPASKQSNPYLGLALGRTKNS
jgi:hypothetical protein